MVEIKNTQEVKREKPKMTKQQKREIISYTVTLCSFAVLCYMGYLISDFYIKNHTFKWQSPILFQKPLIIEVKKELKPESKIEVVKPVEAKVPFCYDPITCIRDVGEELGFSNKDILIAINIAKKESGMNPSALNKNKNGSFDVGLMQLNDVHGKRISREDRMNYEKNIRFAYQLRKEQGSWNAWSVCSKKIVDCN